MDELLGQSLKQDVMTSNGLVLIPAGTILKQEHLRMLQSHHIHADELRVAPKELSDPSVALVKKAVSYSKDVFTRTKLHKKVPLMDIKQDLIPTVRQAAANPDLYKLLEAVRAKDEYIHQHNVGVSVLATLLGKWCRLDEQEMNLLILGAALHDVGKIHISDEILHKTEKLTHEEFEEMKRHTRYGYELLKDVVGLHPRVAHIALQHHERDDGSGYPLKLKASQIDPLSRIVAVADVFHAMSSTRPYHEALPFYEVISRMKQGTFGELDPVIVSTFLKNMVSNLVGKQVLLSDGRNGEVVYINPHEDTSPLVRVDGLYVDLSRERDIRIKEVIA